MADEPQSNWYPPKDHPREDTDRIIFDNLYTLRDQAAAKPEPQAAKSGMSVTALAPGGLTIGGTTYFNLTFKNGLLVAVS